MDCIVKRLELKFSSACGLTLAVALLQGFAPQARAELPGATVFAEECADCHSVAPGKHKKAPSLWEVVGRKAGGFSDFSYSEPMKTSGLVWTPEKLDGYLTKPRKVVPGGKMKYDGLEDSKARADLIKYLATLR